MSELALLYVSLVRLRYSFSLTLSATGKFDAYSVEASSFFHNDCFKVNFLIGEI